MDCWHEKHAGRFRIKSSINCPRCVFPIKQSWKPVFDGIKGIELIYVLWVDRYHLIGLLICWLIDWLIKGLSTFLHLMFRLLRADQQQLKMSHSLKSLFYISNLYVIMIESDPISPFDKEHVFFFTTCFY